MRRAANRLTPVGLIALLAAAMPTCMTAQVPRSDLIAEAMEQFETTDVLELLTAALNPNIPEPLDTVWGSGYLAALGGADSAAVDRRFRYFCRRDAGCFGSGN